MVRWFGMLAAVLITTAAQAAPVLVDGAWLEKQLGKDNVVVVDMSDDDTQYLRFHLPGAVRLDYGALTRPAPRGKPRPRLTDAEFAVLLGKLGIARDSQVVIYDDMGGLNAGRLFLELERIGHPQVSVLNGGLVQWILDGRKVDNRPVTRKPVRYVVNTDQRRDNLATLDDVRTAGAKKITLLDVRTEEEYVGDPKERRSGHVPGARFWPWEQAVQMEDGFVMRDAEALRASLARSGVTDSSQPVILYCRSGHRASQTYLTLRHLGFEHVRLHSGSMLEYLQETAAPLTRGNMP
jgi:thiosulfate/3-mercaptopyruvate sulfurtransferase